jgi:23S rRNA (adenine2030-N6)-methyltransferase
MNYRHHFHAGNFADVVKHALVVALVRGMQRKPRGCLFLDTHAGRGGYDLTEAVTGDTLPRQPEYPDGIGRLWGRSDLPPPLADYVALVRTFDQASERMVRKGLLDSVAADRSGTVRPFPHFYPGSPWLLRLLARPQDRLVLYERHPEECEALRISLGREDRVSVHARDGYGAPAAALPPPEKRALVLIDPPFEDAGEGARIVGALRDGLRRSPAATYAIWYPLTVRAQVGALLASLGELALPPTLQAETVVDPDSPRIRGCGLLIVNPPWHFDRDVAPMMSYLAAVLGQAPGARSQLPWLVPEV